MSEVQVRQIQYASETYQQAVALRRQILRAPLGLDFSARDLEGEKDSYHFAAFIDDRLVGCLILLPLDREHVKMRQVAVALECQFSGVGRRLVTTAEEFALRAGFVEIQLSARESAVAFYKRLSYQVSGDPYIEVTLPHSRMRKRLV